MELDIIQLQTTWNDAAGSINSNFTKLMQAIASLESGGGGGGSIGELTYDMVIAALGYTPASVSSLKSLAYKDTVAWPDITNKMKAGNEFNFIPAKFDYDVVHFNYRCDDGSAATTKISQYEFLDGQLGSYASLKSKSFIVNGGTSSQFLKADGSVDSTAYLSTAGGTISGVFGALTIKRHSEHASGIKYENTNGVLGYLGFNGSEPYFWGENLSNAKALIHTGNYSNYALPLSGGTISGNLVITGALEANMGITVSSSRLLMKNCIRFNQYNEDKEYLLGMTVAGGTLMWYDGSKWNRILNVGNVGDYALKTDGSNKMGASAYINWDTAEGEEDYSAYNDGIRLLGYNPTTGNYMGGIHVGTYYGWQIVRDGYTGAVRVRYYDRPTSSWSSWKNIAFTSDLDNYLPKTGGTINGPLVISVGSDVKLILNSTDGEYYNKISVREDSEEYGEILFANNITSIRGFGNLVYNSDTVLTTNNIRSYTAGDSLKLDGVSPSLYLRKDANLINNIDVNELKGMRFYVNAMGNGSGNTNMPISFGYLLNLCDSSASDAIYYKGVQISFGSGDVLQFRRHWEYAWQPWKTILHSGNVGEYALKIDGSNRMTAGIKWEAATTWDVIGEGSNQGLRIVEAGGTTMNGAPSKYAIGLAVSSWYGFTLAHDASAGAEVFKLKSQSMSSWKTIAFTDSAVDITFANEKGVAGTTTNGDKYTMLYLSNANNVLLGYYTSHAGLNTKINGNNVYLNYGTNHTTGLILNSSGNVTIGNSDLARSNRKLFIDGSASFVIGTQNNITTSDELDLTKTFTITAQNTESNYGLHAWINTSGCVNLQSSYADLSVNKNVYSIALNPLGGNVGIGTTAPQYKLDVAGTGRFSGAVTMASTLTVGGDVTPSAGGTYNLGGNNTRWNNLYCGAIWTSEIGTDSLYVNEHIYSEGEIMSAAYIAADGDVRAGGFLEAVSGVKINTISLLYNEGVMSINASIDPSATGTYNLGSSDYRWKMLYANYIKLQENLEALTATIGTVRISGNEIQTTRSSGAWGLKFVREDGSLFGRLAVYDESEYDSPYSEDSIRYLYIGETLLNQWFSINATRAQFDVTTRTKDVIPSANTTYNLGSTTNQWLNIYGRTVSVTDVDAQRITVDDSILPMEDGTVLLGSSDYKFGEVWSRGVIAEAIDTDTLYVYHSIYTEGGMTVEGTISCKEIKAEQPIQGEWYNIKTSRASDPLGRDNLSKSFFTIIENYNPVLSDNPSMYRICLMTFRKKKGQSKRWRIPMLTPRWNPDDGTILDNKVQHGMAWNKTWWPIYGNKVYWFNATEDTLATCGLSLRVSAEGKFNNSGSKKMRLGVAIFKKTGIGTWGWQRVSNIAEVMLFVNKNEEIYTRVIE